MAYYSNQGMVIQEGAGGVGEYFVSLGQVEQAQAGGGGVHAYREGVLSGMGQYEQAAAGIGQDDGGPLRAYDDGVFSVEETMLDGPLQAYRDGSLGQAPAGGPTLDLKDAQSVIQLKSAIGMGSGAMSQQDKWDTAFYASDIWDDRADALWDFWLDYASKANKQDREALRAATTVTAKGGQYPNATGVGAVISMGVGSPGFPGNPAYFTQNFPKLAIWFQQFANAKAQGKVTEPFFSAEEKIKGKGGGFKLSTIAMVGFGAVVAAGAYLVFRKRKRAA